MAKGLDVHKLIDPVKWASEVGDDAHGVVMRVFAESAGDDASVLDHPFVRRAIEERVRRIMSSTEARARQVADVILKADASGADLEEIVDAVKGTMDQRLIWAATTARTETTGIVNTSALSNAAAAGLATKEWLSSHDEKVRHTHTGLGGGDGQTAPLGAPFVIGGFPLMFPGDPAGPPQEVINCRCSMLFHAGDTPKDAEPFTHEAPQAPALAWQRALLHLNVNPAKIDFLTTLASLRGGSEEAWVDAFDRLLELVQRHALLASVGANDLAAEVRGEAATVLQELGVPTPETQTILLAMAAREST